MLHFLSWEVVIPTSVCSCALSRNDKKNIDKRKKIQYVVFYHILNVFSYLFISLLDRDNTKDIVAGYSNMRLTVCIAYRVSSQD